MKRTGRPRCGRCTPLLGLDRGAALVSVLIMAASFTPLILFSNAFDVLVFPAMGILAALGVLPLP